MLNDPVRAHGNSNQHESTRGPIQRLVPLIVFGRVNRIVREQNEHQTDESQRQYRGDDAAQILLDECLLGSVGRREGRGGGDRNCRCLLRVLAVPGSRGGGERQFVVFF